MPRLEGLGNIVTELRAERAHLVNNLRHVDAALAVLGKLEGGKFATVSRRSLSAAARRKMAAAQKARWAKVRGQSWAQAQNQQLPPQAHSVSSSSKKDCRSSACPVGQGQSRAIEVTLRDLSGVQT